MAPLPELRDLRLHLHVILWCPLRQRKSRAGNEINYQERDVNNTFPLIFVPEKHNLNSHLTSLTSIFMTCAKIERNIYIILFD